MRYLGLIFSVLIAYHTNGQDNNFFQLAGPDNYYPDNFDKTLGVRTVLVKTDCKKCSPPRKQEHTETYLFNAQGLNIGRNSIHRGRKWGMRKFSYNTDGTVNKYQGYSTYHDTMEDSATYENDYGMAWDSTLLTSEVRYTYEPNKKLKTITWLDGEDLSTESVITFYYNSNGKVIKEELVDYPDKGDIILGFKPNSTTEIIEKPDAKKLITNYKLFKYSRDTVFIEYYNKGQLSGKGKHVFNKRGLLSYGATYDLNRELLFQITNVFNEKGKPIEQRIFQTGYDGYGNGGDFAGGDRRTFEYDKLGRLSKIIEYVEGEVFAIDTFEYK